MTTKTKFNFLIPLGTQTTQDYPYYFGMTDEGYLCHVHMVINNEGDVNYLIDYLEDGVGQCFQGSSTPLKEYKELNA